MEKIQINKRVFFWNGITWAVQNELDLIWHGIARTWTDETTMRMDYTSDELYRVMRLVYLPDDGALMSMKEFLQIPTDDGEACKKKLSENVNLSKTLERLFQQSKQYTGITEVKPE